MLPSFIAIDDFLKDPDLARNQAIGLLKSPMMNKGNYPGTMTSKPLSLAGIDEAVSRIVRMKLGPMKNSLHGHCRLTLRSDKGRSGVHIDPAHYSGILFLTRDEHCKGGTDFFRHKRTGLERVPRTASELNQSGYTDPNKLIEDVVNKDSLVPTRWERVMRIPMKFNRLILFSPWLFHNSAPGFGNSAEDGRLICTLFFDQVS